MALTSHDHGIEILAGRWQAQDIAQELESAHCYAAEFGTVLEWCTMATDDLFTGAPSMSRNRRHAASFAESMHRAAVAYTQIRDARRVERVLGGEAA